MPRRGARSQGPVLQAVRRERPQSCPKGSLQGFLSCPTRSIPPSARLGHRGVVVRCCLGATGKAVMWKSASPRLGCGSCAPRVWAEAGRGGAAGLLHLLALSCPRAF